MVRGLDDGACVVANRGGPDRPRMFESTVALPTPKLLTRFAGFDGFVGHAGQIIQMSDPGLFAGGGRKAGHRRYNRLRVGVGQSNHHREED